MKAVNVPPGITIAILKSAANESGSVEHEPIQVIEAGSSVRIVRSQTGELFTHSALLRVDQFEQLPCEANSHSRKTHSLLK